MRKGAFGFLMLVWMAVGLSGCKQNKEVDNQAVPAVEKTIYDPESFSGERALSYVAQLVRLGRRDSGTPGAKQAAQWLESKLQQAGVEAWIDEFDDRNPNGIITFRNVMGKIEGTGEGLILLGSHYDTKVGMDEAFEGANDSGSSSGALIELAHVLNNGPQPPADILFAFFDGEESVYRYGVNDGLHGSKYLARQWQSEGRIDQVKAVIILDMMGDKDLTVTIPRNSSPLLVQHAFRAARELGVRESFSLFPSEILDDHEPFRQLGIPSIDLIDFYFGSRPGLNDYWHTNEDTMDKLSAQSLETVGRVTIQMLNQLLEEGD